MSNYYGAGGRGAGGGYGMGRGVGRGFGASQGGGGGYIPQGQQMRGGPPRYRGGGGGYDYEMVTEPAWEDSVPSSDPRMVPPPSGRVGESSQGQRMPLPRSDQQVPPGQGGGGPSVRYANDCEIIVTAKAQQQYSEMIEKAIKDFHLKVDLMFPKPDVKLAAFIDNIANMGTIFAVVIRPDNEAHRSVSVHVLRGCPKAEEHRNMPLAAAYELIKARYVEIKRKEVGIVPDNMKAILRSLIEEKTLNDTEYDMIIKFLRDRRRKIKTFENRTNNVISDEADDDLFNNPEAEELKQRILAILNGMHPDGERIGDLVVPRPTEPLGALGSEPVIQNMMQSDHSTFNSGGLPTQASSRGRGQSFGRGGY